MHRRNGLFSLCLFLLMNWGRQYCNDLLDVVGIYYLLVWFVFYFDSFDCTMDGFIGIIIKKGTCACEEFYIFGMSTQKNIRKYSSK